MDVDAMTAVFFAGVVIVCLAAMLALSRQNRRMTDAVLATNGELLVQFDKLTEANLAFSDVQREHMAKRLEVNASELVLRDARARDQARAATMELDPGEPDEAGTVRTQIAYQDRVG